MVSFNPISGGGGGASPAVGHWYADYQTAYQLALALLRDRSTSKIIADYVADLEKDRKDTHELITKAKTEKRQENIERLTALVQRLKTSPVMILGREGKVRQLEALLDQIRHDPASFSGA